MEDERHVSNSMHLDSTCDECGVSPVAGTMYVAKHTYDFVWCETCMKENPVEKSNFITVAKPVPAEELSRMGPTQNDRIEAHSFREAAEKIGQNENVKIAMLSIFSREFSDTDGERLQSALASNIHLQIVHFHTCSLDASREVGDMIVHVCGGITSSTSIKRLFLHLTGRQQNLPCCATALRKMIENNSVIEALIVNRRCGTHRARKKLKASQDKFAQILFSGLGHNTAIRRFRINGYNVLSEQSREVLLGVIAKNQTIKRVHLEFKEKDSRLELLLADNRHKWVERLSEASTPAERRLDVLLEARDCPNVEPVAALFHLMRNCPDFISMSAKRRREKQI